MQRQHISIFRVNLCALFGDGRARFDLDGPGIEYRLGRNFPQTSRPALVPTEPFPQWLPRLSQGQSGRIVALTTQPYLAPRLKKEYIYTSTPLWPPMTCSRVTFPFTLYCPFPLTFNILSQLSTDAAQVTWLDSTLNGRCESYGLSAC